MANGADPGLGNDSRMPLAACAPILYNDALCLRTVKPFSPLPLYLLSVGEKNAYLRLVW